jgi:DNA-binding response OmpR family regulator
MRILLVDDDRDLRTMLRIRLESQGYKVEMACNGEQALSRVMDPGLPMPNLIISDVVMPGMDGRDLLAQVRCRGLRVPFIFLSVVAETQDKFRGLYDADGYVSKPFNPWDLDAKVASLMPSGL